MVDDAPGVQMEVEPPHDGEVGGMLHCAHELWECDYTPVFAREYASSRERCGDGYSLPPSSYAARLSGERWEAYKQKMMRRERDRMAAALHGSNMRIWTPSLLARSVCAVSSNGFLRSIETGGARMASLPATFKFLRLMRSVQPEPVFERSRHVSMYIADQTYEWVGVKKRGRRQALERHDAHGMPVGIEHVVYVNSVKLQLPASLGNLSAADIQRIQANNGSPYTEDYHRVLDPLRPRIVEGYLTEFTMDAVAPIVRVSQQTGTAASALGIRTLGNALYGRPNVDPGGPSAIEILEPIMNCDTKSHEDWRKIARHCSGHSGPETVVDIFMGDGQSCIMAKNEKVCMSAQAHGLSALPSHPGTSPWEA